MRVRSRAYNPPVLDAHALPNDVESLKRLLLEREETVQARDVELREKQRQIEHLKLQLAKLRRARFGQSSEALKGAGQLPLTLEELKATVAEAVHGMQDTPEENGSEPKGQPVRRKKLPEHFDRIEQVIGHVFRVIGDELDAFESSYLVHFVDLLRVRGTRTRLFTSTNHPAKVIR